jgi:hypothetical protein
MQYSAIHNQLLLSQEDLKKFSAEIKYAMAGVRKELKVPLTPRRVEGGLQGIDHVERAILSACQNIGVDFGTQWGNELDLSEYAG